MEGPLFEEEALFDEKAELPADSFLQNVTESPDIDMLGQNHLNY